MTSASTALPPAATRRWGYYCLPVLAGDRLVGRVDPQRIEDAIGRGVYGAAATALSEMQPDEVVEEVTASAIRGRGGGGFPTGRKWQICKRFAADDRYLICNADEGDSGTYSDRMLMEGDPYGLIEAMAIAGYAVGASKGYIYLRSEYPLTHTILSRAIDTLRDAGWLGGDIRGRAVVVAVGAEDIDGLLAFARQNDVGLTIVGPEAPLVLGLVGAVALNWFLDTQYEVGRLPLWYLPAGALALWLLGQAAVLLPARRAANIPPALATRSI